MRTTLFFVLILGVLTPSVGRSDNCGAVTDNVAPPEPQRDTAETTAATGATPAEETPEATGSTGE